MAHRLYLARRQKKAVEKAHSDEYHKHIDRAMPVPGVDLLWRTLAAKEIPWAIATSANPDDAAKLLKIIHAPQPFAKAAEKLGVDLRHSIVVGDAVWDMLSSRRAGALGVGVLTGGYGREELVAAGAYRVYENVGEIARRFTELGL